MYFWEPSKDYTPTSVAPALAIALVIAVAGTLYLGLFPARVLELAKTAADSIYPSPR
jgi:NADH-quinone oxidoreductase subunit N